MILIVKSLFICGGFDAPHSTQLQIL